MGENSWREHRRQEGSWNWLGVGGEAYQEGDRSTPTLALPAPLTSLLGK